MCWCISWCPFWFWFWYKYYKHHKQDQTSTAIPLVHKSSDLVTLPSAFICCFCFSWVNIVPSMFTSLGPVRGRVCWKPKKQSWRPCGKGWQQEWSNVQSRICINYLILFDTCWSWIIWDPSRNLAMYYVRLSINVFLTCFAGSFPPNFLW